jgi:hypothetical protein
MPTMTEAQPIVFLIPSYQPTQIFLDLLGQLREADQS